MNTGFDDASSVDVLGRLPADERKTLEGIAKRRRLRAGDFVYTQGDAVEHDGPSNYWAFAFDTLPGGFGIAVSIQALYETMRTKWPPPAVVSACAPVSIPLDRNTSRSLSPDRWFTSRAGGIGDATLIPVGHSCSA